MYVFPNSDMPDINTKKEKKKKKKRKKKHAFGRISDMREITCTTHSPYLVL